MLCIEVVAQSALAGRCADLLAGWISADVASRGRCVVALSGGRTPGPTWDDLARHDLPWRQVTVTQADERVAPDGHPERNWALLCERLLDVAGVPGTGRLPMPVTDGDLQGAAVRHAARLRQLCGDPPMLDVVHLGLGADGHVASLVPGDPALEETGTVAVTGPYRGRRRMTLTFDALGAARRRLWQVAGADKAGALREAVEGTAVPGSRLRREGTVVVTDEAAAAELGPAARGRP
ncbi:MAG: 6-phosphogluconolactonase [Actinomycetota bacterium]|nr:6-phosphogluconolactonase [Actinomycetota bacterium]